MMICAGICIINGLPCCVRSGGVSGGTAGGICNNTNSDLK